MNVATTCFVCGERGRSRGLLCDECARSIGPVDDALCPEQIITRVSEPVAGKKNAILVDGFGAGHVIVVDDISATLGRSRDSDVCVAERTVSLAHAILEHRPKSNAWFIADVDSENGTWVNGERVVRRWPLELGDRVHLGRRVAFCFVPVDDDDVEAAAQAVRETTRETRTDTRRDVRFDDGRPLRVRAVTEGGAIASWGEASDARAQLTELEYELLAVLERRFRDEEKLDAAVRGFVPASHLLEVLSFKSEAPTHANLRGLVRKVRGKLAAGNPSLDVIESKKGLGYRLARPLDLG
jgi:hypothetical protein